MKTLIADKFSETHLDQLTQLGCEVTYKPGVKAEELPGLIGPYKSWWSAANRSRPRR